MKNKKRHKTIGTPNRKKTNLKKKVEKISTFQRATHFLKSFWGVVSIILTLLGAMFIPPIYKLWHSSHDEYISQNYTSDVNGINLIPDKNGDVAILVGKNTLMTNYSILRTGYEVPMALVAVGVSNDSYFQAIKSSEETYHLKLKLISDRIYLSCVLRDFNGEYLGEVDYDQWKLLNRKTVNFISNERVFEVYDVDNNVVFSMYLDSNNKLNIAGYFATNAIIEVIPKNGGMSFYNRLDKVGLNSALDEIKQIPHATM